MCFGSGGRRARQRMGCAAARHQTVAADRGGSSGPSLIGLTQAGGPTPDLLIPRCCQSPAATRVALSFGVLVILFMQPQSALAQCATTGTNPITLTCAANTTTTQTSNTASPNPATNDQTQQLNASIIGQVNSGVTVNGFGLSIVSTLPGSTVSMTDNGTISTAQGAGNRALQNRGGSTRQFRNVQLFGHRQHHQYGGW